jgi:hypothetical protein
MFNINIVIVVVIISISIGTSTRIAPKFLFFRYDVVIVILLPLLV